MTDRNPLEGRTVRIRAGTVVAMGERLGESAQGAVYAAKLGSASRAVNLPGAGLRHRDIKAKKPWVTMVIDFGSVQDRIYIG